MSEASQRPRIRGGRVGQPADCRAGQHVASARVRIDADGTQHSSCRYCGCELTRLPVIRRWYRSGMLGTD